MDHSEKRMSDSSIPQDLSSTQIEITESKDLIDMGKCMKTTEDTTIPDPPKGKASFKCVKSTIRIFISKITFSTRIYSFNQSNRLFWNSTYVWFHEFHGYGNSLHVTRQSISGHCRHGQSNTN